MSDAIFPERESKLIEFKLVVPKFDALIKTCIAFANAAGGKIVIGVDDETHKILGVMDDDRIKIYDDFPNSLYDSTTPSLIAQIYEQNFGEKSILIIEIPASPRKPYFLKSKGISNGTYIRVGSSTRKATQEYIEDLTREAQRISFDEEPVHINTDALSKELLQNFLGRKITNKRLLSDRIITAKSANKEEYQPTIAGTLMFSKNPDEHIPEAMIRCTQFQGTQGREILQTEDISGPIEHQALMSLKLISRWLSTHYALQGVKLKQQFLIPVEALREAILNALLHRKYNIPGAVKIAVYDNRVEIFSPGCFPGLVDINSLGDGTTYLRNPILVRLAYQINLIETRGTGIRLIYDSCKKAKILKPVYHEEGDFVKLIFRFEPDILEYANEDEVIIIFARLQKSISAQQLSNYLSVSRNTALRKLSRLINAKKLKRIGKGPGIKYVAI